jgi:hypothetical protein
VGAVDAWSLVIGIGEKLQQLFVSETPPQSSGGRDRAPPGMSRWPRVDRGALDLLDAVPVSRREPSVRSTTMRGHGRRPARRPGNRSRSRAVGRSASIASGGRSSSPLVDSSPSGRATRRESPVAAHARDFSLFLVRCYPWTVRVRRGGKRGFVTLLGGVTKLMALMTVTVLGIGPMIHWFNHQGRQW